ncbi:hypothetical protein OCU04_012047 [Sclerotinia nivalis]|uniref:Uncharacterized protein n=1 Tax=Sclerotinia nivalis TaxID=352851 RepID=A0A9X0DE03_9HELO|nr:hypothetical protein OCU04_012047 [Sclerotinia nivalis]
MAILVSLVTKENMYTYLIGSLIASSTRSHPKRIMAGSTSGPELWEASDDSSNSDHEHEHEEQVARAYDGIDEEDDTIEDEGEDEDEDTLAFPPEDIKTDLGKLLDSAETTGEIFSHGPFPKARNLHQR